MASISPALIAPLRAALQSQGFPAASITDAGDVDPIALASGVYDTIEFRTNVLPPVQVNTLSLSDQSPSGGWSKLVQPTLIFKGTHGTATLAPSGQASSALGWVVPIGIAAGLVMLGAMLAKAKVL